jgi:hypothetical protein
MATRDELVALLRREKDRRRVRGCVRDGELLPAGDERGQRSDEGEDDQLRP